jgi:hypothetical protein
VEVYMKKRGVGLEGSSREFGGVLFILYFYYFFFINKWKIKTDR